MPKFIILMLSTSLIFSACSTFRAKEFDRGGIASQLGIEKPKYDEADIKKAFQKKPNLPKPFKLAVYFKTPKAVSGYDKEQWRWTEQDKAFFDNIAKSMTTQKNVSEVFPIIDSMVADESLKSLRLLAAKHQADALLIISGAGEITRYLNPAGASYILLVPALFVPGSQAQTLFVTSAVIWDVRNEYLYLTSQTEVTTEERFVAAFGKSDKELYNEAKSLSLKKLEQELKTSLENKKL